MSLFNIEPDLLILFNYKGDFIIGAQFTRRQWMCICFSIMLKHCINLTLPLLCFFGCREDHLMSTYEFSRRTSWTLCPCETLPCWVPSSVKSGHRDSLLLINSGQVANLLLIHGISFMSTSCFFKISTMLCEYTTHVSGSVQPVFHRMLVS